MRSLHLVGEASHGYQFLDGYHLPPLMLMTDEVEAVIAALHMVKTWSGEVLANSAESVLKSYCQS